MMTAFIDILEARRRIKPYLQPTALEQSGELGAWLKLENLNPTRSFKIRGALNAVLALSEDERKKGIVACSAGNHAQGIALAAHLTGVPAKVVMPIHTPKRKVSGAERYGAEIILHGELYDDAEIHARELEASTGMTFVSPYNDRQVAAGQGTIGVEIFEQLPEAARVIVPASGGGLLGGVALACKTLNPNCEVIGVQSVATPAMYNFFYDTDHPQLDTLAEGLAGDIEAGSITFDLCESYADRIILVEESQIEEAIRWMVQTHNWIIEGAAAVGIAALLNGQIERDDRPAVVIISGANIDFEVLKRLLG